MNFKFPASELDNATSIIKLKKVLNRGDLIIFHIEDYSEYRITYGIKRKRASLLGPKSEPLLRQTWCYKSQREKCAARYNARRGMLNLEEEMDYLPEPIRDFIIFNLDLFT